MFNYKFINIPEYTWRMFYCPIPSVSTNELICSDEETFTKLTKESSRTLYILQVEQILTKL